MTMPDVSASWHVAIPLADESMTLDSSHALPSPYALPYVVALTGHRDLHPSDTDVVAAQLFQSIQLIAAAMPHTPIHFLSALADGADQLFAEQVIRFQRESASQTLQGQRRIELIVPLPMPFEQYCIEQAGGMQLQQADPQGFEVARKEFTSRFLRYSAAAAKVFVIPQQLPSSPLSLAQSPAQAAYAQLTRYFGIHAQLLIAVWDGQPETAQFPRRPGGTLDLVQTLLQGVERSKHPRSSNRFAEPVQGTVLHVYSRRARASSVGLPTATQVAGFRLVRGVNAENPSNAGQSDLASGKNNITIGYWENLQPDWPGVQAPTLMQCLRSPIRASERWAEHRNWRSHVAQVEQRLGHPCTPAALAVLYRVRAGGHEIDRLNQLHQRFLLNRDNATATRYAEHLGSSAHSFLSSLGLSGVAALPAGLGLGLGAVLQTFSTVDVLAERTKRYWRYRWRFLASAAMLASASSSLRLLNPANGDLIESLAFSVGALFAVGTYLWVALSSQRNAYLDYRALAEGLRFQMYWMCAGESTLVTDHYVQKYGGEIGWVRHALDACMVVHPVSGIPARQVLRSWIADQLAYLNGNGNRQRRRQHSLSVARGNNLLLTGLLCSVAALTLVSLSGRNYPMALALLIGGMKLATGVGAAWLSLNHKMGHGETLMQADQLRNVYARAELALTQLETTSSSEAEKERHARDLLFALGKAVLEENACWLAAYQQRRVSWHGK